MRIQNKIIAITGIVFCSIFTASAQELTLQQCIEQALETNFALKISRNDVKQLENNINYGQFMPRVDVSAGQNQKITDSKSEMEGVVEKQNAITTNNYNVSGGLSWRLFDGLGMFFTQSKYKTMLEIGEIGLQSEIEQLIMNVSSGYYNVIRQQSKLQATKHSLELSAERYRVATDKYHLEMLSRLELQQAKLDFNADSARYMTQTEQVNAAYITLNEIMNREFSDAINIKDSISLAPQMPLQTLSENMLSQNSMLEMARKRQKLTSIELKNAKASLYPTVDFNTGYNLNHNHFPEGVTTLTQTKGPYWGFSVQMNVFNRLEDRKKIKNAKLDIENQQISYQEAEWGMKAELAQLYNSYQNNIQLLLFEKENVIIAFDNLDAALEKFRLGTLSGIEFRESQRSYIEAVDREVTALYLAKISELALLLISGDLRVIEL
ncbi:MAG: TolC family protein [Marinifilaceae bacterium]